MSSDASCDSVVVDTVVTAGVVVGGAAGDVGRDVGVTSVGTCVCW